MIHRRHSTLLSSDTSTDIDTSACQPPRKQGLGDATVGTHPRHTALSGPGHGPGQARSSM